ncbi:MAG: N-acyl-D-amino-acid deacylase, partial [Pseudohongiellaceae bacterium]
MLYSRTLLPVLIAFLISACGTPQETSTQTYDFIIKNGQIYDGNGGTPYIADIAIIGDRIAGIGGLSKTGEVAAFKESEAKEVIDAQGLAVAPGFINMLSWATSSLIKDGRSQSDIRQGVTLEVFGEGNSEGPLNDVMKAQLSADEEYGDTAIGWTTLNEYLEFLTTKGISPNVASFIGATTVRVHELGYEDRAPNPEELERMQDLVRQAM